MVALTRYWKMWRVNPAATGTGYQSYEPPQAETFLRQQVLQQETACLNNEVIQASLFKDFWDNGRGNSSLQQAQAGLCLRCYVSYPLLNACKKLSSLFNAGKAFTYYDLLPFVLNDDGTTLIIVEKSRSTQLRLDDQGTVRPATYSFFTLEVLRTFNPQAPSHLSLDNWAYLQAKSQPQLKQFLSEFGFKHFSDWALLNRASTSQLDCLVGQERQLVEVFQAVYRRDRRQQSPQSRKQCPNPTKEQLEEMLSLLQQRGVNLTTPAELLAQLQQVAQTLKQYDLWNRRGSPVSQSLDSLDPQQGDDMTQVLPEDLERQECLTFLYQQFEAILARAIAQTLQDHIAKLERSSRYAPLASAVIPGLQYYYLQEKSLREIAPLLGMPNWDKARRILNPGEILSQVRTYAVQSLLESLLKKAQALGLAGTPPDSDYLSHLTQQVEIFVDEEAFKEAAQEIRVGKHRCLKSPYAQKIRQYLAKTCSKEQ